jgi:hypothetical protein
MKITKRQLRQIIKEEKAKLMLEYTDMTDPRLMSFQQALEDAFFNAMETGADINELGQVAEKFMATMGYEG